MSRTRVKICGITRLEDAFAAINNGADALGFVFFAGSPRAVSPELASSIIDALPAFISKVGLFVNAEADQVTETCRHVNLDYLQFHGDESPAYCESFGRPYIKSMAIRAGLDLEASLSPYQQAAGLLLDTWHPDMAGGTGKSFNWHLLDNLPANVAPIILAGGLHAGNVNAAIAQVKPYAVDVSSGVEDSPGIKSANKIRAFMKEVNGV